MEEKELFKNKQWGLSFLFIFPILQRHFDIWIYFFTHIFATSAVVLLCEKIVRENTKLYSEIYIFRKEWCIKNLNIHYSFIFLQRT